MKQQIVELIEFESEIQFKVLLYEVNSTNEEIEFLDEFSNPKALFGAIQHSITLGLNLSQVFHFSLDKPAIPLNRQQLLQAIQQKFPTLDLAEQSIQIFTDLEDPYYYVSIIQQQIVRKVLQLFGAFEVNDLALGVFPILPLLKEQSIEEINLSKLKINKVGNEFKVNKVQLLSEPVINEPEYKFHYIKSLLNIDQNLIINHLGLPVEFAKTKENQQKLIFLKKYTLPVVVLLFILMIGNQIIQQQKNQLNNEYQESKSLLNAYEQLKNSDGLFQQNQPVFSSLMIDEIMALKPSKIVVNNLEYTAEKTTIVCQIPENNNALITNWIDKIEDQPWINQVQLKTYNKRDKFEFELEITY